MVYNNKTINNLFLHENTYNNIFPKIDSFKHLNKLYKDNGIPYKKGFMFYGVPGCGKTSSIYAIASYYSSMIYKVQLNNYTSATQLYQSFSTIPNKSIVIIEDIDTFNMSKIRNKKKFILPMTSDTEVKDIIAYTLMDMALLKKYSGIMHLAGHSDFDIVHLAKYYLSVSEYDLDIIKQLDLIINKNIDLFIEHLEERRFVKSKNSFDIIDAHIQNEEKNTNIKEDNNTITLGNLLDILDGNEFLADSIIIFTTNYPNRIDNALIRAGRIDNKVEFLPADKTLTIKIFKHFYPNLETCQMDKLESLPGKFTITHAKLINTIILSNLDNIDNAIQLL